MVGPAQHVESRLMMTDVSLAAELALSTDGLVCIDRLLDTSVRISCQSVGACPDGCPQ